jgi:uncharacterized metal-binding protein YceD (DUF177 family)
MTAPEFSRPLRLDQIGTGDSQVHVVAEPAERAALAERFDLQAIDSLEGDYAIRRDAAGIVARGRVTARVTQSCIATGDPVPAAIDEGFAIRFVPESEEDAGDEVELAEDECDVVFYAGGAIDLGEAAAETLALALDPFPRSPDAEAVLKQAGVLSEEEARRLAEESGPFGALAALKGKLEKDD